MGYPPEKMYLHRSLAYVLHMGLNIPFHLFQIDGSVQDYATHYIKEEDMMSPDDYATPKVGRPPKVVFPEFEEAPVVNKSHAKSREIPCVKLPKPDVDLVEQTNQSVKSEEQGDLGSDMEDAEMHSSEELELQAEPQGQPGINLPNLALQFQNQNTRRDQPILDLTVDKRLPFPFNLMNHTSSQSSPYGMNSIAGILSSPEGSNKSDSDPNTSRRKRGRPRKISDDSIKAQFPAGPYTLGMTQYDNVPDCNQPIQMTSQNNQPISNIKAEPQIDGAAQDFSQRSAKPNFNNEDFDLNRNSAGNSNTQEPENTSFRQTSTPDIPETSTSDSAYGNQSATQPRATDQSESNSNSQSEAFLRIKQESNQSEESETSPGQSENSFQGGPVFPHMEEYFNASAADGSMNVSVFCLI